jgi:hypothetical protein
VIQMLRELVDGGRSAVFWGGLVGLAASKKLKVRTLCGDDAGIGTFVFVVHFLFAFSASIASACAILSARTSQA